MRVLTYSLNVFTEFFFFFFFSQFFSSFITRESDRTKLWLFCSSVDDEPCYRYINSNLVLQILINLNLLIIRMRYPTWSVVLACHSLYVYIYIFICCS